MSLPTDIKTTAIEILRNHIPLEDKEHFKELVNKHGLRNWILIRKSKYQR